MAPGWPGPRQAFSITPVTIESNNRWPEVLPLPTCGVCGLQLGRIGKGWHCVRCTIGPRKHPLEGWAPVHPPDQRCTWKACRTCFPQPTTERDAPMGCRVCGYFADANPTKPADMHMPGCPLKALQDDMARITQQVADAVNGVEKMVLDQLARSARVSTTAPLSINFANTAPSAVDMPAIFPTGGSVQRQIEREERSLETKETPLVRSRSTPPFYWCNERPPTPAELDNWKEIATRALDILGSPFSSNEPPAAGFEQQTIERLAGYTLSTTLEVQRLRAQIEQLTAAIEDRADD